MSIPQKLNLNQIVANICHNLLHDNKLITVKNVYNVFIKLYPTLNVNEYVKENFINSINVWRISKLNVDPANNLKISSVNVNNNVYEGYSQDNHLYKENIKLKKELSRYKREVRFLQAKIKSLHSCYNRQRKDFVMRIQRMLYQGDQSWR